MTTIANRVYPHKTARLLEMNPTGDSFERLQVLIGSQIEESILRQDMGNGLTKFSRGTIAYHIKDACQFDSN